MSDSPTSRSLGLLRGLGYMAAVVERRLPRGFVTQDLFGCIDILAVKPGERDIGVQACVVGDQQKRRRKAAALGSLRTWLESGHLFEVWGWAKKLNAGGKRLTWQVTRTPVTLADLPKPGTPSDETDPDGDPAARAADAGPDPG